MNTTTNTLPKARRDDLNVQAVGGELLVYDRTNDQAHALNGPAAFVWQQADGTRSIDDIAREMSREFGATADAQVVWYALDQLERQHLMANHAQPPREWQGLTRRQFIKGAAAGAVLLAVVTTIVAPMPAHAATGCAKGDTACAEPRK